jgi:hypothetical protein
LFTVDSFINSQGARASNHLTIYIFARTQTISLSIVTGSQHGEYK